MLVCLTLWLQGSSLKTIFFHYATLSGCAPLLCLIAHRFVLLLHPFSCWTPIFFSLVLTFVWYFLIFSFFFDGLIVIIHSPSFLQPLLWTLIRQVVYLCLIKVFLEIKGLPICAQHVGPGCAPPVVAGLQLQCGYGWSSLTQAGWDRNCCYRDKQGFQWGTHPSSSRFPVEYQSGP